MDAERVVNLSPSSLEGAWGGGGAPSPEKVLILALNMMSFGAF